MSLDQDDDLLQPPQAHPLPQQHDHEHDISLSMLSMGLSRIQDQVKFADAKGGFLATLGILLAGFVVQPASHLAATGGIALWIVHILLGLYLLATFLSVTCVLLGVMPRLTDSKPHTMTFFSHISAEFGRDSLRYCQQAQNMTHDQWAQELSAQIVAVSHIADRKHRLIHRASLWMIGSLALWIAVLAAIQFVH
jgi:hypothetical protein